MKPNTSLKPSLTPRLSPRLSPLALAAALALGSGALNAAPRSFNGAGSFWDVVANWTGGILPGAGDDALLGGFNSEVRTNFTINSFIGTGTLTVSAGGLNFAAASSTGALNLSGGTLAGTGNLAVAGNFNWTGGTMTGTGSTSVGGALTISGAGVKDLTSGRSLAAAGTTTWTNTAAENGRIRTGTGAAIHNSGSWNDQLAFNGAISADFGGSTTFNNTGSYNKGGAGSTTISIAFNNTSAGAGTGVVAVNAGALRLTGGGTSNGSFSGQAGTTLALGGGHNLQAASSINSAGTVDFTGSGNNTVGGSYSAGAGTLFSGGVTTFTGTVNNVGSSITATGGTGNFNNAQAMSTGAISLGSGSVNFNNTGGVTASSLDIAGGTLGGTSTVAVTGASTWSSGTMTGSGTTLANGALTLSGAAVKDLTGGRTLSVAGTTTWTHTAANNGRIRTGGSAVINNNGSWLDQLAFEGAISADFGGNATFNNNGSYTKSGAGLTAIGIAFNNTSAGAGSGVVAVNAGTLRLSGGGTSNGSFTGTAGTTLSLGGNQVLQAGSSLNTAGTVDFFSGTNTLAGSFSAGTATTFTGGTTTFTGTVSAVGSTIAASGGTGTFNNTQPFVVSALTIASGGLNFNNTGGVTTGTLGLTGGTLGGTSTVAVTGATTWSSGTMTGSGTTLAAGTLAISGAAVKDLTGGRSLSASNTTWTNTAANNGRIRTGGTAVIHNTGTWADQLAFDAAISPDFGGSATFDNSGVYTKSGSAVTTIGIAFDNTSAGAGTGVVNIDAGTLALTGGGSSNGSFQGAGTLNFGGGVYNLAAGSSIANPNVVFASGTTNVGGAYNVSGSTTVNGGTANFTGSVANTGGSLSVSSGSANFSNAAGVTVSSLALSGGSVGGTQDLSVTGATTWTAGTMTGSGRTLANGTLVISGASVKDITGGRTLSASNTTWTNTGASNGRIRTGGTTAINNTGTWADQLAFDSAISPDFGGSANFNNTGSYNKTGAGTTTISIAFNNTAADAAHGIVNVSAGTLVLSGGGVSNGSFQGTGTLGFGGGTQELLAGSSVANANVFFSGGTTNVAGSYGVTGTTTVNGGTANFLGTVATAGGNLVISSGAGNFSNSAGVTFSTLALSGGSLGGTQDLDITGPATWTAGGMTGTGRTTTLGTLAISGTQVHDITGGRTLRTAGTTTWTNTGDDLGRIRTGPNVTLDNTGTWLDQSAFNTRISADFGGPGTFANAGTYTKSGAGVTDIQIAFNNAGSGVVNLDSGTFGIGGGGASTGLFNLAAGTTLGFVAGAYTLDGSVAAAAGSRVLVNGGVVTTVGNKTVGGLLEVASGTFTANGPTTVASYLQTGGTLNGTGNLQITGAATWTGGTMAGSGRTTSSGTLAISGTQLHDINTGRTLSTAGTTTWTNTGSDLGRIRTGPNVTIDNTGTWLDQNAFNTRISPDFGGPGTFANAGTYTKSGAALTDISITFNNAASGVVNLDSGTLNLGGGGTSTGLFNLAAGTTLGFDAGVYTLDGNLAALAGSRMLVNFGSVTTVGSKTIGGLLEMTAGAFTANGPTTVATFLQSGGVLGGTGNMQITGAATWAGGGMSGTGTTTTSGALAINGAAVHDINAGRTLSTVGTTTWTNTGADSSRIRTGPSTTIANSGTWQDQNAFNNRISPDFGGPGTFANAGLYAKSGAGSTDISIAFNNTGSVLVVGGALVLTGGFTNFSGTTLTGGAIEVQGASSLRFTGANVVTNASSITLDGAGSGLLNATGGSNGLANFASNTGAGSFTIRNGRDFSTAGAFGNAGLVTVGTASTFTGNGAFTNQGSGTLQLVGGNATATSLANAGNVNGFGNLGVLVQNTGQLQASGGTLSANGGVQGAGGSVLIDSGATLSLSGSAVASSALLLADAGSLDLGTQAFNVFGDYSNTSFGNGNSFNARAGVSGSGQIVGVNADMSLTGQVASAGANVYTLDLGNVRGGSTVTRSFQVANSGTGASLRGALQTGGAGQGHISDARLSGSGVADFSFGPIAAGGNGGDLSITLTAGAAGGALAGQSVAVVSNFGNVATQTLQLSGFTSVLAQGLATPAGPVDLGNFRVGHLPDASTTLSLTNTTTGDGAERLGLASATASGPFTASNVLGSGLVLPGATAAGAVGVATSGGAVGANSGSVTLQFTSNGTLIDPSFNTLATNLQVVAISATGFEVAQPALPLSPVSVGNYRLTTGASSSFTVANTHVAPAGFQELLNASFGGAAPGVTVAGAIAGLAPGDSSNAMAIGFAAGGAAGPRSGSATVNLVSDGTGTSNLGLFNLASGTVDVSGTAFNVAVGAATPTPVLVPNQRMNGVGGSATVALAVTNAAPAGSFSEALNASFQASSGSATTNGGSLANLAAGASNSTALVVGIDNTQAGNRSGSVTLAYQTDGTGSNGHSGLAAVGAGSQTLAVSGDVYRLASASNVLPAGPVVIANQRVGGTLSQALTFSNLAAADGFSEALNGSVSASSTATAGGSFGLLAPGASSSAIIVGVDTGSAGAKAGVATVALASDGAGSSGFAAFALASQQVAVSGNVYRFAVPVVDTSPITLVARVGDAAPVASIGVSNNAPDAFTERLNASLASTSAAFTAAGSISGLAPNASSNALSVSLATTTAGSFGAGGTALAQVALVSSGAGTTLAPDEALGTASVTLAGRVYAPAVAQVNTPVLDFGIVRVGDTVAARGVSVSNAASGDLSDTLRAQFSGGGAPFTAAGTVDGLGAGGTNASALQVQLDTGSAGVFSDTAMLAFTSQNPELADLLQGGAGIALHAQVNHLAQVALAQAGGSGNLAGGGTTYTLNFGNVAQGAGSFSAALGVGNAAVGTADALAGLWDLSGVQAGDAFTLSGFDSFAGLGAGGTLGGLTVSFDSGLVGSFDSVVVLHGLSTNGSGPDLALADLTLHLQGTVVAVPEPGTAVLWVAGLVLLVRRARRALPLAA